MAGVQSVSLRVVGDETQKYSELRSQRASPVISKSLDGGCRDNMAWKKPSVLKIP